MIMDIQCHGVSFFILISFIVLQRILRTGGCELPSQLQNDTWIYKKANGNNFTLVTDTNSIAGFALNTFGSTLSTFNCINNTSDLIILRSESSYREFGVEQFLYLCVKFTYLSANLIKFYILNEENNDVVDSYYSNIERAYSLKPEPADPAALPLCSFCIDSSLVNVADIRTLNRQGTYENTTEGEAPCDCDTDCLPSLTVCSIPDAVEHSTNVSTGSNPDDTINYSCSSGYEVTSGNLSRTCQSDGSWSGSAPVCTIICPSPDSVEHSSNVTTGDNPDDTITYTCDMGYEITSGTLKRTCQSDGSWSNSAPVCTIICPSPGSVENSSNVASGDNPDDTITYTCNIGHEVTSGNLTRTCQRDGSWSGSAPTCTIICASPDNVEYSSNVSTGDNPDDTITYTCDQGYEVTTGNSIRTCQLDGSWSGTAPVCTIICTNPNAVLRSSNVKDGDNPGNTISYTCDEGYEVTSGNLVRTCQLDGSWSGAPPVCTIICPDPISTPHVTYRLNGNNPSETAEFQCESGYVHYSGSLIRVCQANGQWDGTEARCYAPADFYNEEVTMIIAGVVAGICLICAILVIILCLVCKIFSKKT